MKCYYNCCESEEQKPHVVKHGVRNGIQRYRCLNCKRTFIHPNDRKNIGLKDYEKYIIERLVNESVSYRAVYDCTGIKTFFKHHSKLCLFKKKLNEVLEKFEKIKCKISNLDHAEIDFIVIDEIYSWVLRRYKNCLVKNKKTVSKKENNYSYILRSYHFNLSKKW